MKPRTVLVPITILFVAALAFGVLALPSLGFPGNDRTGEVQADVNGSYTGPVALEGAYPGTLNDVATPQPLDLGGIELALDLAQTDNDVAGYVVLSDTLVFTREHTIMVTPVGPTPGPGTPEPAAYEIEIGPQVEGSFDGTSLLLLSEPFSTTVSGREVTRQFSLVSTGVRDGGATIEGEYRETLWGYAPQPSTLVGTFRLHRPVFPGPGVFYDVYLPLLVRKTH